MNKTLIFSLFISIMFSVTSCSSSKVAASADIKEQDKEMSVTGKITKIENGGDGYMATIKGADGKDYIGTISIVNLQKNGGTFKRHEVGETITIKGPSWKDNDGIIHITVRELK